MSPAETSAAAGDATLRAGLARYFAESGFAPDGGYAERWVVLRAGGIPVLAFPNTDARRRAVRFHDLHHVLTGYRTDWRGEAEIAAWEIASGCADHVPAWILNLYALAIGLALAPRRVARAFQRGRHCRNCYRRHYDAELLERPLSALRSELGLASTPPAARAADRLALIAGCAASLGLWALSLLPGSALLAFALR